jgi:hypothetical protein
MNATPLFSATNLPLRGQRGSSEFVRFIRIRKVHQNLEEEMISVGNLRIARMRRTRESSSRGAK